MKNWLLCVTLLSAVGMTIDGFFLIFVIRADWWLVLISLVGLPAIFFSLGWKKRNDPVPEYHWAHDEEQPTRKLRSFSLPISIRPSCLGGLILIAAIVIGVIVLALNFPNLNLIGSSNSAKPVIVNVAAQKRLNVMETYSMTLQVHVIGEQKTNLGPIELKTDKHFLADGQVVAGINFTETPEDIKIEGNKVTVTLPYPKILHHYIDQNQSSYIDGSGLLPVTSDLYLIMNQNAEDKLLKTALENGILEQAAEQATLIEENRMYKLGYDEVVINMAPAPTTIPEPLPTAIVP